MREKLLGLLKGAMFFAALATTGIVEDEAVIVTDRITQERVYWMKVERLAKMYASTIVDCAKGGYFVVDNVVIFCDPYQPTPRIEQ